jgi:hypothetical protein
MTKPRKSVEHWAKQAWRLMKEPPFEGQRGLIKDVIERAQIDAMMPSLLDDFAGRAMQGMLACQDFMNDLCKITESKEEARAELARHSFAQAVAMLEEREKRAAKTEEVTKKPGPKFKTGQTVRVVVEGKHENHTGWITGSEAAEGGEWKYGVQLVEEFRPYCSEDELEAVDDGGKEPK